MTKPKALDGRRQQVFTGLLSSFPPGRLVDLGAGHGQFSIIAADYGWQVTAVDARVERFPDDPRIEWRQQDVREIDLSGFDVILCLGLFYHLTMTDQVDLISRFSGVPVILDTHVDTGEHTHPLSDRERVGEYEGRWYTEPGVLTSSWKNPRSFWPTPESLYAMLAAGGYPVVLAASPWTLPDRTFFLALPEGDPARAAQRRASGGAGWRRAWQRISAPGRGRPGREPADRNASLVG